jgi:hypothetical protein
VIDLDLDEDGALFTLEDDDGVLVLRRVKVQGDLDTALGDSGVVTTDLRPATEQIGRVVQDWLGRVYVAGAVDCGGSQCVVGVELYSPDSRAIAPAFGNSGQRTRRRAATRPLSR